MIEKLDDVAGESIDVERIWPWRVVALAVAAMIEQDAAI
jgi:hypothetical protein